MKYYLVAERDDGFPAIKEEISAEQHAAYRANMLIIFPIF
jgi:hypothetical protein